MSAERQPLLSEQVAERLLQTILSRSLLPGDRLPTERELGEQFGVSRTVVREAVRALVAKGVIEVRVGSGLRVAAVTPAAVTESLNLYLSARQFDYTQVHEVRKTLEVQIAGTAAREATEGDLAAIADVQHQMEAAKGDVEAAARFDLAFHRAVARATHNELYTVLLDAIGPALLDVRLRTLSAGSGPDAMRAHRDILEALRRRDAAAAQAAMTEHLEVVERWRRKHMIDQQSRPNPELTASTRLTRRPPTSPVN